MTFAESVLCVILTLGRAACGETDSRDMHHHKVLTCGHLNKTWHVYIEAFQQFILHTHSTKLPSINIQMFCWIQVSCSQFFKQNYSQQMKKTYKPMMLWSRRKTVLYDYNIVHRASGTIYKTGELDVVPSRGMLYFRDFITGLWRFELSPFLALNISVFDLYLTGGVMDCVMGRLSIDPFRNKSYLDEDVFSDYSLVYCGHYSLIQVYPFFKDAKLSLLGHREIFYMFNASYSPVDSTLVTSVPVNNSEKQEPYLQLSVQHKRALIVYFVLVKKHRKIEVAVQRWNKTVDIVLYDGPGFLSKAIVSNSGIFVSSSFQAIVQVVLGPTIFTEDFIHFTEKEHRTHKVKRLNHLNGNDLFTFDSHSCKEGLCVVSFLSHNGSHVNVTVEHMEYRGKDVDKTSCRYGGLVSVEENQQNYWESFALCTNHSRAKNFSRSLYSQHSSLTLIFYWYVRYSNISVTATVSETTCDLVKIDPCSLQKYCDPYDNKVECERYLHKFDTLTAVTLTMKEDFTIDVQLTDNQCCILHFQEKEVNASQIKPCSFTEHFHSVHFSPQSTIRPDVSISMTMTGSFSKDNFFSSTNENIQFNNKNATEEFCFLNENQKAIVCNKSVIQSEIKHLIRVADQNIDYFRQSSSGNTSSNIFFSLVWQAAHFGSALQLRILLFMYSRGTWLDIVFRKYTPHLKTAHAHSILLDMFYLSQLHMLQSNSTCHLWNTPTDRAYGLVLQLVIPNGHQPNCDLATATLSSELFGQNTFYWGEDLNWMDTMSLLAFTHRKHKCISLPGGIVSLKLLLRHKRTGLNLTTSWIHDGYVPAHDIAEKFCSKCAEDNALDVGRRNVFLCFNFSSHNPKTPHYFAFIHKRKIDGAIFESWVGASEMCDNAGGTLPHFTSSYELGLFIAVLKLSRFIPALEALYIGLMLKQVSVYFLF